MASSVDYYAAHCSLVSCCVKIFYDFMERRSISKENERQGERLFLSHLVPVLRKWPYLHGGVSFRAFPRTWLHYMEIETAVDPFDEAGEGVNTASNVGDKILSTALFLSSRHTCPIIFQRRVLYSMPAYKCEQRYIPNGLDAYR